MNGGYDEIKNEFASYHHGYNIDECLKSMREKYSGQRYSAYEFVFTKCFLDHDGYDRYGPKSNLYDLYVFFKRKSVDVGDDDGVDDDTHANSGCGEKIQRYINVDIWHAEEWYTKGEKVILYPSHSYSIRKETFEWFLAEDERGGFVRAHSVFDKKDMIDYKDHYDFDTYEY